MKHITLLGLIALMTLPTAQGQIVFESGFEDWTGSTPDGWFGAKTNIAQSSVIQVSENPHSGTYAVRLQNTGSSHQRFTTQPLTVTAGQSYEITFWLRGTGEVRTGLFDGRSTLSGYFYNAYVTATDSWTEVVQQITAAEDTTLAEFILSVRNTLETEHLVIDDVNISMVTTPEPDDVTIQEIQESSAPDGASPLAGNIIRTTGVVTATVGTSGFFIQDGGGEWSGIYIFSAPTGLQRGDSVRVTATVVEFNGQTQLSNASNIEDLGSGYSVPLTTISTVDGNTEPFESVLVTVESATCTAEGQFGQFTVNDGSGSVLVDDVIYAHPFIVGEVYDITGVLQYAFSEWRILPRDAADVDLVTSLGELAEQAVNVFPNPATDMLTISLDELDKRVDYVLVDAMGRTVRADVLTQDRTVIDLDGVTGGAYVLTLRSADSVRSTRVVIQR